MADTQLVNTAVAAADFWTKATAVATGAAVIVALFVAWVPIVAGAVASRRKNRSLAAASAAIVARARQSTEASRLLLAGWMRTERLATIPARAASLHIAEVELVRTLLLQFDTMPQPEASTDVLARLARIDHLIDVLAATSVVNAGNTITEILNSLVGEMEAAQEPLEALEVILERAIPHKWWEHFFGG
jgi:hypothetical protein